jgi:hypothetical protein
MVHGEDLADLRDQIKRKISQIEVACWRRTCARAATSCDRVS